MFPRIWHVKAAPANAIYVGRPTRWGNPHRVGWCVTCRRLHTRREAIQVFKAELTPRQKQDARRELRGYDLSCWCYPYPCHAGVWREIANA